MIFCQFMSRPQKQFDHLHAAARLHDSGSLEEIVVPVASLLLLGLRFPEEPAPCRTLDDRPDIGLEVLSWSLDSALAVESHDRPLRFAMLPSVADFRDDGRGSVLQYGILHSQAPLITKTPFTNTLVVPITTVSYPFTN